MRFEDCFFLGTVVGKYSFKGEVLLKLDTDEPELYQSLDSLFITQNNALIPFFVEKCSMHKPGLLRLRLEDVDNEEDANLILKSKAYLPLTKLPKLTGKKFYYHEVIGFDVIDKNLGKIGSIVSINEHTAHATIEVSIGDKIALIPIVDEIILEVKRDAKSIYVDTPAGLIDLYIKDV
jgi:16S rRNA processing protein RimM